MFLNTNVKAGARKSEEGNEEHNVTTRPIATCIRLTQAAERGTLKPCGPRRAAGPSGPRHAHGGVFVLLRQAEEDKRTRRGPGTEIEKGMRVTKAGRLAMAWRDGGAVEVRRLRVD